MRADLGPLELKVVLAIVNLVSSYSRLTDDIGAKQLAAIVYGIPPQEVTGGQRERVSRALASLHARGVLIAEPGRGRNARTRITLETRSYDATNPNPKHVPAATRKTAKHVPAATETRSCGELNAFPPRGTSEESLRGVNRGENSEKRASTNETPLEAALARAARTWTSPDQLLSDGECVDVRGAFEGVVNIRRQAKAVAFALARIVQSDGLDAIADELHRRIDVDPAPDDDNNCSWPPSTLLIEDDLSRWIGTQTIYNRTDPPEIGYLIDAAGRDPFAWRLADHADSSWAAAAEAAAIAACRLVSTLDSCHLNGYHSTDGMELASKALDLWEAGPRRPPSEIVRAAKWMLLKAAE